jgi:hypothetical protein
MMLPMKTKYGWVEIDGVRYDHDVIIHVDRKVTRREKKGSKKLKQKYGHTPLSGSELDLLTKEHPAVIYIGTGQFGDLPIARDAELVLERYETIVRKTPELMDMLAEEKRPFIAVLHVKT